MRFEVSFPTESFFAVFTSKLRRSIAFIFQMCDNRPRMFVLLIACTAMVPSSIGIIYSAVVYSTYNDHYLNAFNE